MSAHLLVGHAYTALWRPDPMVAASFDAALTATRHVYLGGGLSDVEYVPLFTVSWDGSRVFLTGLLAHLLSRFNAENVPYQIHDQRRWDLVSSGEDYQTDFQGELFPDQQAVVQSMVQHGRGVVHAATNAGKTYITGAYWHVMGRPTMLVLTEQKSLIEQNAEDLERLCGLPEGSIGRVGGGHSSWRPVTVATNASADNRAKSTGSFPYEYSILIADEGDTLIKTKAERIVRVLANTPHRFWLSGTPYRNRQVEDMLITGYAGALIGRITNKSLIEQGRSAHPHVLFVNNFLAEHRNDLRDDDNGERMDGRDRYKRFLVENPDRNDLVRAIAGYGIDRNQTVLTFVEQIKHAQEIMRLCPEAILVTGSGPGSTSKYQQRIIESLKSTKGIHVIVTGTWRRGLSIPNIDILINAAGLKSPTYLLQRLGRLLRKKSGDNVGWLVDFQDRNGINLTKHAGERAWTFRRDGIPVYSVEPELLLVGDLPGFNVPFEHPGVSEYKF
jgi:superfamily II DNA or RNA helicase